jgi:hypothetical protein
MKLGILVIHNMMHEGRQLEGKHLMDNESWLLSSKRVLFLGVLLDSSETSDSSPGWA